MKKYILEFIKRGMMAAFGGPIIVAIVLCILELCKIVTTFTPGEILLANITSSLLVFIIAGSSVFYQIEKISLFVSTSIHLLVLYITYLFVYLVNGWLQNNIEAFLVFSAIFIVGYFIIWGIVVFFTKKDANELNKNLIRE